MERLGVFCILAILAIVTINKSEAAVVTFLRTEPSVVQRGGNVTFIWTYSGSEPVQTASLYVNETGKPLTPMVYAFLLRDPPPLTVEKASFDYAGNITWVGNLTGNVLAFKLTNVSDNAHQKLFAVRFQYQAKMQKEVFINKPLFISVFPEMVLSVESRNLTVGETLTAKCYIRRGRPSPRIQWYHNDKLIGRETESLRIENVKKERGGWYKCSGENQAGVSVSGPLEITVKGKPEPQNPVTGKSSSGLGGGAIAGIVIGILVLIVVIIVVVYLVMKTDRKRPKKNKPTVHDDESKSAMVDHPKEKDQVWL